MGRWEEFNMKKICNPALLNFPEVEPPLLVGTIPTETWLLGVMKQFIESYTQISDIAIQMM